MYPCYFEECNVCTLHYSSLELARRGFKLTQMAIFAVKRCQNSGLGVCSEGSINARRCLEAATFQLARHTKYQVMRFNFGAIDINSVYRQYCMAIGVGVLMHIDTS